MKNIIQIAILILGITFLTTTFISAQEHNHKHKTDIKKETHQMMDAKKIDKNKDGKVFQCSMKCEVPQDKPGECSKCGMKLNKVSVNDVNVEVMKEMKEHKANTDLSKIDKNKDGYVYECPMKCEHAKDKPGECSVCGMKLKEVKQNLDKHSHKHKK